MPKKSIRVSRVIRPVMGIVLGLLAAAGGMDRPRQSAVPSNTGMIRVPGGEYQPFYKTQGEIRTIPVIDFLLDASPVSRSEFLGFLADHPGWRKSRVKPIFAEDAYLEDWPGDFEPGPSEAAGPVVFVSWFAAKAYCESHGKRLPSVAEWEWARKAAADAELRPISPGRREPEGLHPALRLAMGQGGAGGLEFGQVWEWTSDFNSTSASTRSGKVSGQGEASSLFCGDGMRVADPSDYASFLRFSFRSSLKAGFTLKNLGFRCAKNLP